MNNSKTPKIIVGVGLAAVYAFGLTFLTLRDRNVTVAESEPSATSAQMVADPASPVLGTNESTDALASAEAPASELIAPAAAPVVVAPAPSPAVKAPDARAPVASAPTPRVEEVPVESMPSPRPPVMSASEELSRSNSGTNAVSELASTPDSGTGESVSSADEAAPEVDESTEAPALDTTNQ